MSSRLLAKNGLGSPDRGDRFLGTAALLPEEKIEAILHLGRMCCQESKKGGTRFCPGLAG